MSCKAYNGRIVLEYLGSISRLAAARQAAQGPNRTFGSWLLAEVAAGTRAFPTDPKIPLQVLALCLVVDSKAIRYCFSDTGSYDVLFRV